MSQSTLKTVQFTDVPVVEGRNGHGASIYVEVPLTGDDMSKPQIATVGSEAYHQLTVRQVSERIRNETSQPCKVVAQTSCEQVGHDDEPTTPKLDVIPEHLF